MSENIAGTESAPPVILNGVESAHPVILSGARSAESKDPVRREAAQPVAGDAAAGSFGDALEGQVGLGVDIVEIARMRAILERTPSFRTRVYSEEERAYCDAAAMPEVHYATRFAAKEAVLKALGTGFSQGIGVRDVEVKRNAKGRPYVVLSGRAKDVARERGVRELPLSLSYTHTDAVACAMAITEDSVRAAEERVNPMEELAKQFKEARSMLDELETAEPAKQTTPSAAATEVPRTPAD